MAITSEITVNAPDEIVIQIDFNDTLHIEVSGDENETFATVLQAAAQKVNSNLLVVNKETGQVTVNGQVFVLRDGETRLINDVTLESPRPGDRVTAATRQSNG